MNAELRLRQHLDALLDYWRAKHRVRLDAYEAAVARNPLAAEIDPILRSNLDYAAGAVAALAMLARGEYPSGPERPPSQS